ncbi:putative membrane protein [Oopsacas minuta]|uniref:Membrane protein n=1 Tax=Oopsacas minuta TaxID=111878 RepID=A0AAV7KLD5_9METZ|nr:putative membrane protein [Oopsacas minuta]
MAAAMHLEGLRRQYAVDRQRWKFLNEETKFSKYDATKIAEPPKAPRRVKTFSANLNRNVQEVWWPFRTERPYTGCLKKRLSEVDYFTQCDELNIGIHLCFTLCAYDTMFTYIGLAQSAAFAELSQVQEVRRTTTLSHELTSLITATFLIGVQYTTSHGQSIRGMQYTAIAIAIIGFICQRYASNYLELDSDMSLEGERQLESEDWKIISIQVLKNKNFLAFVFMNFGQIFHKTFSSSFFNIFSRDVIPETALKSHFILFSSGIMFFLPQLIVLGVFAPALPKVGAFRIVMTSHIITMFSPIIIYILGMQHPYLIILYMTIDSGLASATFSLFNMLVADVIDSDTAMYNRKKPISSIIFGLNALFTKPAHSLCPMLVVNILTRYGYQETDETKSLSVQNAEFHMLCLLPVCIGLYQILIWSNYSLRSTHEKTEADKTTII